MKYPLHPACAAWPQMSDDDLLKLAENIKANGLLETIILTQDGQVLDGRNRLLACEMVGVEPHVAFYEGTDEVAFSISKNLNRRHLSQRELAFIGADLAKLKRGGDRGNQFTGGKVANATLPLDSTTKSAKRVAKELGIDRAMVMDAKSIRDHASPNVVILAKSGKVGLRKAAEFGRNTPHDEQERATPAIIRASKSPGRKTPKAKPEKRANPPFRWAKLPEGADLVGLNPNQRVHLHPFTVKQMLDAESTTKAMLNAVLVAAGETQLEASAFFEAIDKMLGWVPEKGGTNGKQWDFAKRADSIITQLEPALYAAHQRLTAYISALEARKQAKAS